MIGTTEGGWNTNADAQGEGTSPIGLGCGGWGTPCARRRIGTRGGSIPPPYLSHLFSLSEVYAMAEVIQRTEHEVAPGETETADIFDLSVIGIEPDAKRSVDGFSASAKPVVFRADAIVCRREGDHERRNGFGHVDFDVRWSGYAILDRHLRRVGKGSVWKPGKECSGRDFELGLGIKRGDGDDGLFLCCGGERQKGVRDFVLCIQGVDDLRAKSRVGSQDFLLVLGAVERTGA